MDTTAWLVEVDVLRDRVAGLEAASADGERRRREADAAALAWSRVALAMAVALGLEPADAPPVVVRRVPEDGARWPAGAATTRARADGLDRDNARLRAALAALVAATGPFDGAVDVPDGAIVVDICDACGTSATRPTPLVHNPGCAWVAARDLLAREPSP